MTYSMIEEPTMKFKGFEILPQYCPGSDFTVCDNDVVKKRIPKPKDVDFFTVTETKTGWQHANASSYIDAKKSITRLIEVLALE